MSFVLAATLLVPSDAVALYRCADIWDVEVEEVADPSRFQLVPEHKRTEILRDAVEFNVCRERPRDLGRVLATAARFGMEGNIEQWQVWETIGMRENPQLARVAVKYIAPEKWPAEAIDLALRTGSYGFMRYRDPDTAAKEAIQVGLEDLALALGMSEEKALYGQYSALRNPTKIDEDLALEIFEKIAGRVGQGDANPLVEDALARGQYRLAERLLELGAIPRAQAIASLAREINREALLFVLSTPHFDPHCPNIIRLVFGEVGFRQTGSEFDERWNLLLDVVAACGNGDEVPENLREASSQRQAVVLLESGVDSFYSALSDKEGGREFDPDLTDERGFTGLLNALVREDLLLAQVYLVAGADAGICGVDGGRERCPLWEALEIPSFHLVETLRKHGADQDEGPDGEPRESVWSRVGFRKLHSASSFEPGSMEYERAQMERRLDRARRGESITLPEETTSDGAGAAQPRFSVGVPQFFGYECSDPSEKWEFECTGRQFTLRFGGRVESLRGLGLSLARTFGVRTRFANSARPTRSSGEMTPDGRWRRTVAGYRQHVLVVLQVETSEWLGPEADSLALRVFENFEVSAPPPLLSRRQVKVTGVILLILIAVGAGYVHFFRSGFRGSSSKDEDAEEWELDA